VWQKNFIWYVDWDGKTLEYRDGMKLEKTVVVSPWPDCFHVVTER